MILWAFFAAFLLTIPGLAEATVIFSASSDAYTDGTDLPNPPFCGIDPGGCGAGTGTGQTKGKAQAAAGCDAAVSAPTGALCFKWNIVANQADSYNEIKGTGGIDYVITEGEVLYLAYQENYTRLSGNDVWHDGGNTSQQKQSGDKGVGLRGGDTTDFRWDVSHGQWDSMCWNTDHKWTVWVGNPTNHFNPGIEVGDAIRPNVSPYGVSCGAEGTDGPQLDYERWYNIVFEIKFADTSPKDGYVKLYINGTKVLEYLGIQTANTFAGSNITLDLIEFGGTIAQSNYDTPAHTRYYDNFIVATSASDVSSFMLDPEVSTLPTLRLSGGGRSSGAVRFQ